MQKKIFLIIFISLVLLIIQIIAPSIIFSQDEDNSEALPNQKPKTQIILLGTGTPNADPDRSGPAVAIVINDTPYLVDCGVGVVRRAAAAFKKGVSGLEVTKLNRVFITHLHSDHTLGLADLILTPWILGREVPLEIFGPEGSKRMSGNIFAAYQEDIHMRLYGLEPANTTGYKANVFEIEPGIVYQDKNVIVEAFSVKHGSWPVCFGFKFKTSDKTVVISGDTVPCENLVQYAKGCDVLIHEVYSEIQLQKRAPEWQTYHKANHTSTKELAEIAVKIKPGLLVLYHQLFWGSTDDELLKEIGEIYPGKVISGKDLDIF